MKKYEAIFKRYIEDYPETDSPQVNGLLCPFHHDKNRGNLSINTELGIYNCFACGAHGNVYQFYASMEGVTQEEAKIIVDGQIIEPSVVDMYVNNLRNRDDIMSFLLTKRCLTEHVINKYKLGYDLVTERITIPIYINGELVNIRKYRPFAQEKENKYIGIKGKNEAQWFPVEHLDESVLYFVEGEMDCLAAISAEILAVTCTLPRKTKEYYTIVHKLRNKQVILLYDNDKAGRVMVQEIIKIILPYTKDIKNIIFPQETKDITEYLRKYGKESLHRLILETSWERGESIEIVSYSPIEFHEIFNPTYRDKNVSVVISVAGRDKERYFVPKKLGIVCPANLSICKRCGIAGFGGKFEYEYKSNDKDLIQFIGVQSSIKEDRIKDMFKIPSKCNVCMMNEHSSYTLTAYLGQQDVKTYLEQPKAVYDQTSVIMFNIGDSGLLDVGQVYKVDGKIVANPKTQAVCLLIDNYREIAEDVPDYSKFNINALSVSENYDSVDIAFSSKISELEDIIGISKRKDLVTFAAIAFHTPLEMLINNSVVKCCFDHIVVGDTTTGKTETYRRLSRLYHAGVIISGELGTNERGLIGGVVEVIRGSWVIVWGLIPKSHKKLYVIDEFQDLPENIINNLSRVRREGVAEIIKVASAKTPALCRSILLANTRSNKMISQFGYGVQAVTDLIEAKQDIARFDVALLVSRDEVPYVDTRDEVRLPDDAYNYSMIVKRIWDLSPFEVVITPEVLRLSKQLDEELTEKYRCDIPLIDGATTYKKLLRIASGIAGVLVSFKDDHLIIKPEHVELASALLCQVYDKPACAYNLYASTYKLKHDVDVVTLIEYFENVNVPSKRVFVENLLLTDIVTHQMLMDFGGFSKEQAQDSISYLLRINAIERAKTGYNKTPKFNTFLKLYLSKVKDKVVNL